MTWWWPEMGLRGPKARPVVDRFADKVALTDSGCIEWIAGTNGCGYGFLRLDPENDSRKCYAHRWSYEHHRGPIPEGLVIDHPCRNTLCVNPDHLEAVPERENLLRGISSPAINAAKTHCLRGHPLSGDNLRIYKGTGYRQCRTCMRMQAAIRRNRKRKAA